MQFDELLRHQNWWRAWVVVFIATIPHFAYLLESLRHPSVQERVSALMTASVLNQKPQGLEQWIFFVWNLIAALISIVAIWLTFKHMFFCGC